MKRFKLSRKHVLAIVGLFFVILIGGGIYFFNKTQDEGLSAEQISQKFDCDRITADFRYTDVFCSNPKFYNNPGGVTPEEYYDHLGCKERLQDKPPAESLEKTDPGFYNAYYECKDPVKLEQLRQDFIQNLKELKAKDN